MHSLDTIAVLTLACQHVNSQGMAARVDHVQSVEGCSCYTWKRCLWFLFGYFGLGPKGSQMLQEVHVGNDTKESEPDAGPTKLQAICSAMREAMESSSERSAFLRPACHVACCPWRFRSRASPRPGS